MEKFFVLSKFAKKVVVLKEQGEMFIVNMVCRQGLFGNFGVRWHSKKIIGKIARITDPILPVGGFPSLHLNVSGDDNAKQPRDVKRIEGSRRAFTQCSRKNCDFEMFENVRAETASFDEHCRLHDPDLNEMINKPFDSFSSEKRILHGGGSSS